MNAMIAAIEALRPKSPGPNGVWKLPNGDEYYKSQIEFWTTVPGLTADEIHKIGLAEVARIRGEMEAIMKKVGFQGDLPAFFKHLRTDPANFFPNTDAGRQAYLDQSKAYIDADLLRRRQVLQRAAEGAARGPRASRNGARRRRRSRSTTSRRRTAAGRASTT